MIDGWTLSAPRQYDGASEVRRYVRSGRWSGEVALDMPPASASLLDVGARYGIAYLGVRRLVDRLTAARTYLAVLRRRLRRGEASPAEVEVHLERVERQLDAAAVATAEVKRVVDPIG